MSRQSFRHEKAGKRFNIVIWKARIASAAIMSSMAHPLYPSGWQYQVQINTWIWSAKLYVANITIN